MMYGGVGEMGVASQPSKSTYAFPASNSRLNSPPTTSTSMSQGFHQGILSFPDRLIHESVSQEQPQHVAQQSSYDKLRVHGFDGAQAHQQPLVPIEEERGANVGVYESPGGSMLSDMFNFATPRHTPTDLLAVQISGGGSYRSTVQQLGGMANFPGEWHGVNRQEMPIGGTTYPQPRPPWRAPLAAALHSHPLNQSFSEIPFAGGMIEVQGLSLSLSSSQQPFEIAKAEEPSVREGLLYFNSQQQEQQPRQQLIHMNYAATGAANVLRNFKYSRAAQELLEEFCSVGKGRMKGSKMAKSGSSNPNPNESSGGGRGAASTPAVAFSGSKDVTPLSPADRFEHQKKKTKLIAMLDEVGKRYNHYCDQMQMVVNSFDSIMGFGAATPYTSLAQKAMSRHFRCLKDSIAAELKQTCELLGDKEGACNSGITKGETPRLRLLDQTLRQQRAFHQMGMMDQEAWRPQRGLPERSVNILRAWLFEHFLHPYPSDADKHLLARQTGLSRNQVSNWFINARVRLWKPMVEDMYQQEFKDEELSEKSEEESHQTSHSPTQQQLQQQLQQQDCRPQLTNAPSETEPSPSSPFISRHHHQFAVSSNNALPLTQHTGAGGDSLFFGIADSLSSHPLVAPADDMYRYGAAAAAAAVALVPAAQVRFGSASSDISLTLGLQQGTGGNVPDSGPSSSLRDF